MTIEDIENFALFDRVVAKRATLIVGPSAAMAASLRRWADARMVEIEEDVTEDDVTELRCLMSFGGEFSSSISVIEPNLPCPVIHGR